ncbi:expressed unknown protein [Seminavis robusta]|uniref:Uncharacterized protein n=1 Tax=Seminavis robusta TaxID=568900 RepID=A0A9N8DIE5_9STRA|nr:expressed unknown protein [Seminavis robusta]|eukprot:Sro100_g051300.1 n/a (491) ;mRNA; f:70963-72435
MTESFLTQDGTSSHEESFLKIWLTRIVVTAAIAMVLEYLMGTAKGPAQEAPYQKEEEEEVMTMQYTELKGPSLVEEEPENDIVDADDADQTDENEQIDDNRDDKINDTALEKEDRTQEDSTQDEQEESEDPDENGDLTNEETDSNGVSSAANETETNNGNTSTGTGSATPVVEEAPKPIQFRNKSIYHPGMEGFHRWYDVETSLFRQYNVGRTDGVDVIPPYVPKSRNGQVKVALRVTNHYSMKINVYWINYQGREDFKGSISRGETWYQTTYVEHPWVFRLADSGEPEEPLLVHYIPERVIPHLDEVPTIEDEHPMVGVQRFNITGPTPEALRDSYICSIDDAVIPHPAKHHFHNPNQAHTWTLLQMKRLSYFDYNPGATMLMKYLKNIAMDPDNSSYRRIRISNKKFAQGIWLTPARGLLLAAGFVEQQAFAELGTAKPLSSGLVQDISLVLHRLEQCLTELSQQADLAPREQPDGADGSGRAGFRRL